jgi:hypothetical protein
MRWGARKLEAAQLELVRGSLLYARTHGEGLPEGLLDRVQSLLDGGAVLTRSSRDRARYLAVPGLGSWIELNPEALGLDVRYDWRAALRTCSGEGEERARQEALIRAKADQQWLFVAAALVHEGSHAHAGLSLHRAADERAAYGAECRFLSNVLDSCPSPLVRSAAGSLLADARRDARQQEGLDL